MIRYAYINQVVLDIYLKLPYISFPLKLSDVVKQIPNCRQMSYRDFAGLLNCSTDYVIQMCESRTGCTHYDIINDRYLILYNDTIDGYNNIGRQRWTCSHEIGHIVCKHFDFSTYDKLCENVTSAIMAPEYEREADYFASTLLAPFPIMKYLGISSAIETQNTFGFSHEAAFYTFKRYVDWSKKHYKRAWENDMVRAFIGKQ